MKVYAWMAPDRTGEDGILTVMGPHGPMPATFTKKSNAEFFRPQAQARADILGVSVRLAILEEITTEDVLTPRSS